ncbi:MAG: hypothetical protein ACYC0V_21945 [Armatimonadota bacterium]
MIKQDSQIRCQMSNRDDKKARELHVAEAFLACCGLETTGIEPYEEPDFLVTLSNGHSVGLELVEHLQGELDFDAGKLREVEMHWEQLNNKIKYRIENHPDFAALQHVRATIYFKVKSLPKKGRLDALADELVSIETASWQAIPDSGDLIIEDFAIYPLAANYVKKISFRSGPASFYDWSSPTFSVGCVYLNEEHVSQILRSKSYKVPTYKANIEDARLLLVIYSEVAEYLSSFPPPEPEVAGYAKAHSRSLATTGFDEIWFFSCWGSKKWRMYP